MKAKILLVFLTVLISCSEKSDNQTEDVSTLETLDLKQYIEENQIQINGQQSLRGSITITCGSEICSEGEATSTCRVSNSMPSGSLSCTCTNCTMTVTLEDAPNNKVYDVSNNKKILQQLKSAPDFLSNDIKSKNSRPKNYSKVTYYFTEKAIAATFYYQNANGDEDSFTYVKEMNSGQKIADKTFKFSCDGACGCRESYNLETNSVECTCNDCSMTVTEITEAGDEEGGGN